MNKTAERFKAEILRRLDEVTEGQDEAIHEAATVFANTIERGGIIRAFGLGHAYANTLEICGRAGGYIQARIINEPSRGIQPPVFKSANIDGGPEFNQRLLDTFKDRLAEF